MIAQKLTENAFLAVSIDDYDPGNIPLAEKLAGLGIAATFYIAPFTDINGRQQCRELAEIGMTVGSHTLHHPMDMKALSEEEQRGEIQSSKRLIEDLTEQPCLSFCYPRGRYNDVTVQIVRDAGYQDARTTRVMETTLPGDDRFRLGTAVHIYDGRHEYGGRSWSFIAGKLHEKVTAQGGLLHIWGHAEEMRRLGQTDAFLEFLKATTVGIKLENVWL